MWKFLAGVAYTVTMVMALEVGITHTQGDPGEAVVSGWLGLVVMTLAPQLALLVVFLGFKLGD